jgi:cytochrome b involved in lipid metabolism
MRMYCFLLCFISLLPWQPIFAVEKPIPLIEIQSHNSAQNCWIIVNAKVYNITKFIKAHEGKCDEMELTDLCGKDASVRWLAKEKSDHAHKRRSVLKLEQSQIGILQTSPDRK